MLIEGAKMSSIERWDFRCCQQSSAISGEVPSSHPALKTQRLLMTEAWVIPEATMNYYYYLFYFFLHNTYT